MKMLRYLLMLALIPACSSESNEPMPGAADPVAGQSQSAVADAARFDSEIRKSGCELLSAKLVAATFDVPADGLTQMKVMGCRYDWTNDTETVEAAISMIRAHKSEARAAKWFANATRSKTAEEMKAEMEMVSKRLDQKEELDTEVKKSTAKGLLAMVASKAVTFEDVAGLGEEARVNDEGTVYVRVDNLTFMVSAYQGPKAPPSDMKGVEINQMAAVALENAARWMSETAPQRKQDGARLARAIVEEL